MGVLIRTKIAGDACERRADDRKDQQAVEDTVAVLVEKRLGIVSQISCDAGRHEHGRILVGGWRFDRDNAGEREGERLAVLIEKLGERSNFVLAQGFARHDIDRIFERGELSSGCGGVPPNAPAAISSEL